MACQQATQPGRGPWTRTAPPSCSCRTSRCATATVPRCCTTSGCAWPPAASTSSSAPAAPARPRCCASCPWPSRSPAAASCMFGRDATQLDRAETGGLQRRIGVVFQDFRLLDHLSAFENVALPLRLAGADDEQIAGHVGELLGWLGLGEAIEKPPAELSMGQRQLVAVGRAVVGPAEPAARRRAHQQRRRRACAAADAPAALAASAGHHRGGRHPQRAAGPPARLSRCSRWPTAGCSVRRP